MYIYVDEAGNFLPPRSGAPSFSLVAALVVPERHQQQLFEDFKELRGTWPGGQREHKGSQLTAAQTGQVVSLLAAHDTLLEFRAVDMATHTSATVGEFKARQAEGVTRNLTAAHHPRLVAQLTGMKEQIAQMPDQLFVQFALTVELILGVLRTATLYYVQRIPAELGAFRWVIDQKDKTLTEMETLWTKLILPYGEGRFATEPLSTLRGADYSYFQRFDVTPPDAERRPHLEFMRKQFRVRPDAMLDAKMLLSEQRRFVDSKDEIGVQLVDIVATTLRRGLNDRLEQSGWEGIGKLLVRKSQDGSFIQFGRPMAPVPATLGGHAARVWFRLAPRRKSMLVDTVTDERRLRPLRVRKQAIVTTAKVGRNEQCPCGSGKKYKRCCGA